MTAAGEVRLTGKAAAPGRVIGRVHLVTSATLLGPIPASAVLVTRILHPHQAPLLACVAGIVTEEGSLLQHATTLAREFRVPAVVGVRDATRLLREGVLVEVDGDTGVVSMHPSAGGGSP